MRVRGVTVAVALAALNSVGFADAASLEPSMGIVTLIGFAAKSR